MRASSLHSLRFIYALLCLSATPSRDATACTCIGSGTFQKQIKKYPTIFLGEAISQADSESTAWAFTFRVVRTWKGEPGSEVIVRTALSGEACGYHFEIGRYYVVFAYWEGTTLESNRCTPTERAALAKEQIRILDERFHVTTAVPAEQPEP